MIRTLMNQGAGRKQMIHTKGVTEEFTRLFTKVWTGFKGNKNGRSLRF